jgi:hypothetical protein
VQDLQRQLEDLQNKNGEQDGIRKNVTQE